MATNSIYQFAEDPSALVQDNATYLEDSEREVGNQPGIARPDFVNKVLRQVSYMAAALAQFIVDVGEDNVDDSDPLSTVVASIIKAVGKTPLIGAENWSYATVASAASTAPIWVAPANVINYTGVAATTTFPDAPQAGAQRILICADACSFVHGSSLNVQGDTSFTAAAGDIVLVIAITITTFKLIVFKQTGKTVVSLSKSDVGLSNVDNTSDVTKNAAVVTLTNKTLVDAKNTTAINSQSGATYTLVLADNSKLVMFTSATAVAVTIPLNAAVEFPIGTQIDFIQAGAGKVTFGGASVTINSKSANKSIALQWVGVSLIKTGTDTWVLLGDLVA